MPLPSGTRYAVTTTKHGKRVRLAFPPGSPKKGAEPIEAKNLDSGATHSPADFAADRVRADKKRNSYRRAK